MQINQSAILPKIIYVDDFLLVVEKPADMLSVPGKGAGKQACLLRWLQQFYPEVLVVHRLDMATSGLMVFALTKDCQSLISKLFAARQITKHYQAIVVGQPQQTSGIIDLPIGADWPNRPQQKIDFQCGKPSQTYWRLLKVFSLTKPVLSQLELKPITGRTHQLRIHLASIDLPILGDNLYSTKRLNSRLMLHANRLSFTHPFKQQELCFISSLDLAALLNAGFYVDRHYLR